MFEIPAPLRDAFRYKAGQFLTLRIPYDGRVLARCYSLSSSPDCDREHKVTVKRVPEGRVSNWINDHVKAGDVLDVAPPAGLFTLNADSNPLLFFAGGSGITPVISLIKTALVTTDRRIVLVYANRDEASIIFRDELATLAGRYPDRLIIHYHLDLEEGFLNAAGASRFIGRVPGAEVYLCGPAGFMEVVENALEGTGVPRARIHIERFVSPADDAEAGTGRELPAQDAVPASLRVYLDGKMHEVPYRPGETVLAAVQRAGLEPPFSCTEGFCGCCMARLRDGSVEMIKNDFLSERELADGWVLTCQSLPTSRQCHVEYPD